MKTTFIFFYLPFARFIKLTLNKISVSSVVTFFILLNLSHIRAQTPFINNNTSGLPSKDVAGGSANVLFANSDASNHANEFMYFKVYQPGGGANNAWDWYTNPTVYLDPYNFHFTNASLRLYNNNELELGKGVTKEINAGKIAYKKWSDGLDIVGAGTTTANRKVKIWAEGGTETVGGLKVSGHFFLENGEQGEGKVLTSDANGKASWKTLPPIAIAGGALKSILATDTDGTTKWKNIDDVLEWSENLPYIVSYPTLSQDQLANDEYDPITSGGAITYKSGRVDWPFVSSQNADGIDNYNIFNEQSPSLPHISNWNYNRALVLGANSDDSKDKGEYIYFHVGTPGRPGSQSNDYFFEPTAILTDTEFRLYNAKRIIYHDQRDDVHKLVLWQDETKNGANYFYGLGVLNNALRFQGQNFSFFKPNSSTTSMQIFNLNENATIKMNSDTGTAGIALLDNGKYQAHIGSKTTDNTNVNADHRLGIWVANNLVEQQANLNDAKIGYANGVSAIDIYKKGVVVIGAPSRQFAIPENLTASDQTSISLANYKLMVNGGLLANEVRVRTGWADYVFHDDYLLKPLNEVETYIHENGHLPDMPTAKTVEETGIEIGEMSRLQQQKIEELTLYLIEQKKEIEQLKKEIATVKQSMKP